MTLPQLAKAAGLSKGTISKIENGKGNPNVETLQKICNALIVDFRFKPFESLESVG